MAISDFFKQYASLVFLWLLFVCFVPDSVYWRDSGEFLLTGFYLDIPHAPGFPTYAVLANLFSLLPIGSIPFRAHLLSGAVSCIAVFLIHFIGKETIHKNISLSVIVFVLVGSVAFLRQSVTAEVYLLYAVLSLLLFYLYILYKKHQDLRYILLAGFISGIGIGAHVAIIPIVSLGAFFTLLDYKKTYRVLAPSFILFLFGLSLFSYIPLRASNAPPLNTGSVSNSERFIDFITFKRDRVLRAGGINDVGGLGDSSISIFISGVKNDITRLHKEIPLSFLILGLMSMSVFFLANTSVALMALFLILSNYLFFKGWQADPWQLILLFISLGISIVFTTLQSKRFLSTIFLFSLILILIPYQMKSIEHLQKLKNFKLPVSLQKKRLQQLQSQSIFIAEPSWFLLRYTQDIEGIYDEIPTAYLPELLFPYYFSSLKFNNRLDNLFKVKTPLNEARTIPQYKNISLLLKYIWDNTNLVFEPISSINSVFSKIFQLRKNGFLTLEKGAPQLIDDQFTSQYVFAKNKISKINDAHIKEDSYNYLESIAGGASNALENARKFELSLKLLTKICKPLTNSPCSILTQNNIGVLLIRAGRHKEAVQYLSFLVGKKSSKKIIIQKNLTLAKAQLGIQN